MTKHDAISLFGGVPELAAALGITRQAIYQWPDTLSQRVADQVIGAGVRLGKAKEQCATACEESLDDARSKAALEAKGNV